MAFLYCMLATFGLSSAWLYSPGFEEIRAWWTYNMGALAPLAYCQLCCSFWISIPFVAHFLIGGVFAHLSWMLACAGVSWLLGAIAEYYLWAKVNQEQKYKESLL